MSNTITLPESQSPQTGQFNSYLAQAHLIIFSPIASQSPQTGQFNSYYILVVKDDENGVIGLNPLKRVNSILTKELLGIPERTLLCLNPLKRVNSILTERPRLKPFPY